MVSNHRNFAKKNFGRSKNRNWQGSYSFDKEKEESFNKSPNDEVKKDNTLVGHSGYDCNYFHGKNHLEKECMLKRLSDKRDEGEKDESYYLQKIEELKNKKNVDNTKPALIVQEDDNEFRKCNDVNFQTNFSF